MWGEWLVNQLPVVVTAHLLHGTDSRWYLSNHRPDSQLADVTTGHENHTFWPHVHLIAEIGYQTLLADQEW